MTGKISPERPEAPAFARASRGSIALKLYLFFRRLVFLAAFAFFAFFAITTLHVRCWRIRFYRLNAHDFHRLSGYAQRRRWEEGNRNMQTADLNVPLWADS